MTGKMKPENPLFTFFFPLYVEASNHSKSKSTSLYLSYLNTQHKFNSKGIAPLRLEVTANSIDISSEVLNTRPTNQKFEPSGNAYSLLQNLSTLVD